MTNSSVSDLSETVLGRPGTDRFIDVLSDRHRRLILLLVKHESAVRESDVMTRRESDKEKIKRDLEYNHLPKLEEAGYIEWDRETGQIKRGPRFDEIEPLLELIENHADELPPDWP